MKVEYLENTELIADGFTKEFIKQKYERFVKLLRLKDISSYMQKEKTATEEERKETNTELVEEKD